MNGMRYLNEISRSVKRDVPEIVIGSWDPSVSKGLCLSQFNSGIYSRFIGIIKSVYISFLIWL